MKYIIKEVNDWATFFIASPWDKTKHIQHFRKISSLVRQISKKSPEVTLASVETFFKSGGVIILATDSKRRIVGMASLALVVKVNGVTGRAEHVVVDKKHRGKGLATAMMEKIIEIAKAKKLRYLDLTTEPAREEANALYLKLDFKKRNTNPYRLVL